jgi:hypothetical protein
MRPAASSSSAPAIPHGLPRWMISTLPGLGTVAVIGARAATAYGAHVGTEIATALGENGWTVVSGGAYVTKTGSATTGLGRRRRA